MLKKSNLNRLKQNIIKWKEEGYKVDDIEELVKFAENQKQSPEIPSVKKYWRIVLTSLISILISLLFIFVTIPLAFIIGNQYHFEATISYIVKTGFPLNWFNINYDIISNNYVIDFMEINEMNLIMNFVLYIFTIFAILIIADYVINKKIIPRWKKMD